MGENVLPMATFGLATLFTPTLLSARSNDDKTASSLSSNPGPWKGDLYQYARRTTRRDVMVPYFMNEDPKRDSVAIAK